MDTQLKEHIQTELEYAIAIGYADIMGYDEFVVEYVEHIEQNRHITTTE